MTSLDQSPFAGIHTALITPFSKNLHIDFGALKEIIAHQLSNNINGLVVAGTTGEAPTLSLAERVKLVERAKIQTQDKIPVIAGAGSNCTNTAVKYQNILEQAGADAILQTVPYYNKPSPKGQFEHFNKISQHAQKPIILYNAFGRTGIDFAPEAIIKLAQNCENIIGIKDANPDTNRLTKLIFEIKKIRPDFLFLAGEDSSFLPFLALGAHGIISVCSHIAAPELIKIYKNFKQNNINIPQEIFYKTNKLSNIIFSHTNPIGIKTVLANLGFCHNYYRLPLCSLEPEQEKLLLTKLKTCDFLSLFSEKNFLL